MPTTYLADLIQKQVAQTTVATVARTVDAEAELLARELLKDPVVRADLLALVRAAFATAWQQLQAEIPAAGKASPENREHP